MMKKTVLMLFCTLGIYCLNAQKTYIWCGVLIDGFSDEAKKEMTIVIEKDKIVAVQTGYAKPTSGEKTVDLKTKTVTPGWIDMHVHLESETKKGNVAERFILNPPDIAFECIKYANVTLMVGFTTVRDL